MNATSVRGGAIWWMLTKERQEWCNLQCDPCLSALRVCILYKSCYINTIHFIFSSFSFSTCCTGKYLRTDFLWVKCSFSARVWHLLTANLVTQIHFHLNDENIWHTYLLTECKLSKTRDNATTDNNNNHLYVDDNGDDGQQKWRWRQHKTRD